MAEVEKSVSELLDEMAVKVLMIEPGDLSIVGELVILVEELQAHRSTPKNQLFQHMVSHFQAAIEKVIMGELPDTAEAFDTLGQCIVFMQEQNRRPEKDDDSRFAKFREYLQNIGYTLPPESPPAADSDSSETVADEEEILPESGPADLVSEEPAGPVRAEAKPAEPGPRSEAVPAADLDFLKDKDLLKGFIEESFEHLESIEANILEFEQNPDDHEIINNIFRPFHTIKGVSGFLNLKNINKLAHTTESLLDDVRNDRRVMDSAVIDVVLSVGDFIRKMIENIKEALEKGPSSYIDYNIDEYVNCVTQVAGGATPAAVMLEPGSEAEGLGQTTDPPHTAKPSEPALQQASPAAETKAVSQPSTGAKSKISESIKVDVEKLDNLVDAMGELVIMQSLIQQNPLVASINDPKLARDFSQLSRIITDLQKTAMSMRMVPIRQTFQKMVRLVRDLSQKTGKITNLVMTGEDTEIDRNMVDSIYDPLVHMMRNSVDHGVQTPEERKKNGKPPEGTVYLRAYQKGSNIVIEIEDDGQGLDPKRLRKKAVDRGLINESYELSDQEIVNLIMLPGFSTAEKITDVSGRGVGMDVVKRAVEKLRGKVEISSQPGKGCLFTIRLPLTLAIIEGIVVRVGAERYIIPTVAIQESIRPARTQYNTVHGKGETLTVRGELVPLIRLYESFGATPSSSDPCEAIIVVVENEGQKRALMVDELLGKQEVVIKSLGGYMKNIKGVAGGTILGDGRVGLILDLAGLIAFSNTMERPAMV